MNIFQTLVLGAILLGGCQKKTADSDIQSLENFASADGSISRNSCKGNFPLSGSLRLTVDKGDSASMHAIMDAVRAIPPSLQKLYFEADGGHVFATKDFDRACGDTLAQLGTSERSYFAGGLSTSSVCTRVSEEQRALVLQFKPDAQLISHQFVRTFGLTYGRFYGSRRFKDWSEVLGNLAVTFTREVATSNGKFSLSPYEAMFSTASGQQLFDQFVFGEAFDSFYCSDVTRKSFAANFPETFLAFKQIANSIEK